MGNEQEQEATFVQDHKLSSVGPARVTGDTTYEPNNIDLAMKLHYLRLVYFFDSQAAHGLTANIVRLKEILFSWLNYHYEACGRFRRSDPTNRPYIKCNDCGARFVEARSHLTLQEWLELPGSCQTQLVPRHVLGPELAFSPPIFLQITSLKCGGLSVGLSWAHVLGDPFSVAAFMNSLAPFLKGLQPCFPPTVNKSPPNNFHKSTKQPPPNPLSIKRVGPVGDNWTIDPPCEMDSFSFHLTAQTLAQLQMKQYFESISAIIWQAIAKVRDGPEPNTLTVIKPGPKADDGTLRNNQMVCSVKADISIAKASMHELAGLIRDSARDETPLIGDVVGQDPGGSDFIVYGSNLTFVDLGEAEFYGFEMNGIGPKLVNCFVDGVGGDGVVLILPGPNDLKNGDEGRLVTIILPKSYMEDVKDNLKKEWSLIA